MRQGSQPPRFVRRASHVRTRRGRQPQQLPAIKSARAPIASTLAALAARAALAALAAPAAAAPTGTASKLVECRLHHREHGHCFVGASELRR